MHKRAQIMDIEEIPGEKFPDLQSVQIAALPSITESLQSVIRELLESGDLVLINNKIIPAEKDKK